MTPYVVAAAALLVVLVAGMWWALSRHDAGAHRRQTRQDTRTLDRYRARWTPWRATSTGTVSAAALPIVVVRAESTIDPEPAELPAVELSTPEVAPTELSTPEVPADRAVPLGDLPRDPLTDALPPGTRYEASRLVTTAEIPALPAELAEVLAKHAAWVGTPTGAWSTVGVQSSTLVGVIGGES